MPAPPAPGIVALETIFEVEGQLVENTFHYHMSGTIDVAALQLIATTYATWVSAHTTLFSIETSLVKLQARDLTSLSGASIIRNVAPPIVGTVSSPPLPNNVTFSLKRLSGSRGRANRGRIFMIGMANSFLDGSQQSVGPSVADTFVTAYTNLLLSMAADASATEVILHRALGTSIPVIGYAYADLFVDSQRRRLPGHNRHH